LDEGSGKYNPAPQILDEAVCNEWPGRDVGVFVSIGTGKRPDGTNQQQHLWWEGFVSTSVGDFAEARRKLINKIEDCERTHQGMKNHLAKRQVNPENYYRLNVNVGVGEFGMNEWNRLKEISTSTRLYLADTAVQSISLDAAAKLARIHRAKIRWERAEKGQAPYSGIPSKHSWERPLPAVPDASPNVVELPADEVAPEYYNGNPQDAFYLTHPAHRRPSEDEKFAVLSTDDYLQPSDIAPRHSGELSNPNRRSGDQFYVGSTHSSPRVSYEEPHRSSPPPRPPKTPLNGETRLGGLSGPPTLPPPTSSLPRPPPGAPLPYPDTDEPPPVVNRGRKPEFSR
jgi:hypothetical protein